MAKTKKKGLPSGFKIDVDERALDDAPVDLDDFVDSTLPATTPKPRLVPKVEPPSAPRAPASKPPTPRPAVRPVGERELEEPSPARKRRRRVKRPSRKEIGLDPQTIQQLDELLNDVQTQSGEPSATASEVVRSAIAALYEARRYTDYANLGRRGQWGSVSARNFLSDLKDVFVRALKRYGDERLGGD